MFICGCLFLFDTVVHERIDPYLDEHVMRLSRLAHIKRYQKVLEVIATGSNILDAGCGFGYGSKILSDRNMVVGVDISNEAIIYARHHYFADNLSYFRGNISSLDFSAFGKFDAITCFEVLEHVVNPSLSLQNLKEALHHSGKLFISVPNGNNAPVHNSHHMHDYSPQDLEDLLEDNGFEVKQKFGQFPFLGTAAEMAKKITGYSSDTDKRSGVIPRFIDSFPGLPSLFSNIYESSAAVSTGRTVYFIAEQK